MIIENIATEFVEDAPYEQPIKLPISASCKLPERGLLGIKCIEDKRLWVWSQKHIAMLGADDNDVHILATAELTTGATCCHPIGDKALIGSADGIYIAQFDGDVVNVNIMLRTPEPVAAITVHNDKLYYVTDAKVFQISLNSSSTQLTPLLIAELPPFKDAKCIYVHPRTAEIWLGGGRGMGRWTGTEWEWFNNANSGIPTNDVRAFAVDQHGMLWIATSSGPVVFNGKDGWYLLRFEVRLPYEDIRAITFSNDGSIWFATSRGVMRLKDGRWNYFASKRWLPSDDVRGITTDEDGRIYVATAEGIGCIALRELTLEEKAKHMLEITNLRHNRMGYVTSCHLECPGDVDSYVHYASDNDGLWTALFVAAESFRYAVTHSADARENARNSMLALVRLEEVTPIDGFPARAAVRADEEHVRLSSGEWHLSEDGKWRWKGDTSSDEIDGHFFAYGIYYDLVADERDRGIVRDVVRRIIEHIISHDFLLVDVDGEHTTWGVWSPRMLNEDEVWREQRWLNSLEILSHLKTAYHITSDERYQRIYLDLAINHHYAFNSIELKQVHPEHINHSDDELAFLAYFNLLRYEADPHLRQFYLLSLERTWRYERAERCPLWNFIYGALTGNPCDVREAVETLRSIPLDLVHWTVSNSHRIDIAWNPHRKGESLEPLPYGERPMMRWNGNPYRVDDGGDAMSEEDGTFYLLPYWLGRYYGFIR